MVITTSRIGLLTAWRRPGLSVILWGWNLLLATVIAVPAWRWWYDSTAWSPEADIFLSRFSLGVMVELVRNHPALSVLFTTFLALALVAFIGQALVTGGTIEVLATDDARPFMHRFFRGAGHFFWRFLRAAILGASTILVGAIIVIVIARPISRVLEEVDWEPAWYLGQMTILAILALLALVVLLSLDYARIRMVREDSRQTVRAFAGGLAFVLGHPRATVGLWFVISAAAGVLLAGYLLVRGVMPVVSSVLILFMVALQQAVMLVRAGLRVALVAGEIEIWTRTTPPSGLAASLQASAPEVSPPAELGEPTALAGG